MPLVFPVLLLLILGAVTLASRSTSSYLATTKQTDAQSARQAAESGMSRVITALNPLTLATNDPYVSFLLASTWDDSTGWRLTKESRSNVQKILGDCRLSKRGIRESNLPPTSKDVYDKLLPPPDTDPTKTPDLGVIGTTVGDTILRFKIAHYQPPELAETLPTECKDFTTVTGGSGLLTVEGSAWRKGKQVATYRLTRNLDFEGWPLVDMPDSFRLPGPPVGLRIGDQGKGMGALTSAIFLNFENDPLTSVKPLSTLTPSLRPLCGSCSPVPLNGVTAFTGTWDLDPLLDGLKLKLNNLDKDGFAKSSIVFLGGTKKISLDETSPQCKRTLHDGSVNPDGPELTCHIDSITNQNVGVCLTPTQYRPSVAVLEVDTSKYPVNLIIRGNVSSPILEAEPDPMNPSPPPPSVVGCAALISPGSPRLDGRVAIRQKDYDHGDPTARGRWSRLRIFGDPAKTSQKFFIAAKDKPDDITSLHGVFLWLPQGTLNYGNPTYDNVDVVSFPPKVPPDKKWDPTPEASPGDLLSTWWIKNLSLSLSGALRFILPLYGNPEVINSILPGGYTNASGVFTADFRFPAYPSLLRPRGSF